MLIPKEHTKEEGGSQRAPQGAWGGRDAEDKGMRRSQGVKSRMCKSCRTLPPVTCPPRRLLLAPRRRRPGPGPLLGHLLGDRHDPVLRRRTVCPWPQRRLRGGPPGRREELRPRRGEPRPLGVRATRSPSHPRGHLRLGPPALQELHSRVSGRAVELRVAGTQCPRPRLRPTCSHCRAEACQRRVGESQRAAPPSPPANAGEPTARVVQGNGFHPTHTLLLPRETEKDSGG